MAIYRNVQLSFWTDRKVEEEFTPEDKYFYLYLFTNPHTNLCGCYELGIRQAVRETGYNEDTVLRLIKRFEEVHQVIAYSRETSEVLIINWHKYNWTKSADFLKGLFKQIYAVKSSDFRQYLLDLADGRGTVYRPSIDGRGTTVTDTVTDINNNINNKTEDNTDYFDLEVNSQVIFRMWGNRNNFASAKVEWLNRFMGVPEQNWKPLANKIATAVKAYLDDYKKMHPNEQVDYQYLKPMDRFFTEDLDYWLAEVERRNNDRN